MEHVPSFSRDGQWIYFSSTRSGQYQVWKVPVPGGEPVQVTKDGGWLGQESGDGADLYLTATAAVGALVPLWRMPSAGGPAVKVLEGVLNGSFEVVDQGVYYIDQPLPKATLQFFDFASRRSVTIASNLGDAADINGLAASQDGRAILYARRDSAVDDLMLVENVR